MSENIRLHVDYNGKSLVAQVTNSDVGTDNIHIENLTDERTGKVVEVTNDIKEAVRHEFISYVTSLELGFR